MSNKKIQIRVLVKIHTNYRKVADLMITTATGDIYYKPAPNKRLTKDQTIEEFEHLSFHQTGDILLKIKDGTHEPIRHGLPTKNLGFQKLLSDLILAPDQLPLQKRVSEKQDAVFDLSDDKQQIVFILTIVSGKLMAKSYHGEDSAIKPVSVKDKEEVLGLKNIALGHESGNADKILQLLCLRTSGDPKKLNTKRRIKVYKDENIDNK